MLKKMQKQRGMTLIETLMVVGVISTILSVSFIFWNNIRSNILAEQTSRMAVNLGDSLRQSLQFTNQDQFIAGTVTNATLQTIAAELLSSKNASGTTFITNLGTPMTVTYGALLIPNPARQQSHGLQLNLTGLTTKQCTSIVSQYIHTAFPQIRVNTSAAVDTGGGTFIGNLPVLLNSCSNPDSTNAIRYDMPMNVLFQDSSTVTDAYIRTPDSPAFLGSVINGSLYTGGSSCPGGSTWNSTTNSCGCPASTRWMGDACVPFNASGTNTRFIGNCNLNDGYSMTTKRCEALPRANSAAWGIHANNKIMPSHNVTSGANSANNTNTDNGFTPNTTSASTAASVEVIGGRSISTPAVAAGVEFSKVCINGNLTNGRCVSSSTPPVGNW